MASLEKGPPSPDDAIDGPRWNTAEVEDGREEKRFWLPRYLGEYADRIGHRGIAIYTSLAWWITDDAPHHRPALHEIGARAGCSRATVWRALKDLESVGLLEVVGRIDTTGRRAHKLRLRTPPGHRREKPENGTESAGHSKLSAPRAQDERAARSDRARGALKTSAPPLDQNQDLKVCVKSDTHTEVAPSAETPKATPLEIISDLWIALLPGGSPRWRTEVQEEIPDAVELLLSRGWTDEQIERELRRPERDRAEFPRVLVKRMGPKPPAPARPSPSPLIERQREAEEARKLAEYRASPQFQEDLARLRSKIGRRVGDQVEEE